jgi:hypothetical protein
MAKALRPLSELMKWRRRLLRDVEYFETHQGGNTGLGKEGFWSAENEREMLEWARESLREVEQEIAERTGQFPPVAGEAGAAKRSEFVRISEDSALGIRVGRCDGDKRFVSVEEPRGARRVAVFVFDRAGHFLNVVDGAADQAAGALGGRLTRVLSELEPYAFEGAVEVRPFTCKVGGRTCGLLPDRTNGEVRLKVTW